MPSSKETQALAADIQARTMETVKPRDMGGRRTYTFATRMQAKSEGEMTAQNLSFSPFRGPKHNPFQIDKKTLMHL